MPHPTPSTNPMTQTLSDHDQPHERGSPQLLAKPLRTITQSKIPPPKPTVFHGRDEEVERLVALATTSSTAPLGIVGPGGIGKTTLALNVLHDPRIHAHFGKGRLFVSCEDAGGPDDVLSLLALKLGIKRSHNTPLWSTVLDNLRARQNTFLIIDNFESIWSSTDDVLREASEVFLAQLAVLDELTLVVTTRGNILPENFTWANFDTAELDTLSSTAARMIFQDLCFLEPHILASQVEAEALTQLLREVDFMPLAINLLARLDDLPSRLLFEWLEHYTDVLEADYHDGTRRELSVEVSIKISLAHLPAEGGHSRPRELLSVCGQLPAGLFPGVSTRLGSVIPNVDAAISDLVRHSLVYPGGLGELRMLSPVRHYVSARLPMTITTRSAVDQLYLDIASHIHYSWRSDRDECADDVEIPNIVRILSTAIGRLGEDSLMTMLSFAAYCDYYRHTCLALLQKLLPRLSQDRLQSAQCLLFISGQLALSGELHQSIEPLEQAIELFSELGETRCEAISRKKLEIAFQMLGRFEDSNRSRAKAGFLERELSLAWASPAPGDDIQMTIQRYRDARDERLQAGDRSAVVFLSEALINVFAHQRDEAGGQAAFIQELETTVAIGERIVSIREWVAPVKALLANQYLKAGRFDEAEHLLVDAYVVLSEDGDTQDLAMVMGVLGDLRFYQHQVEEAIDIYQAVSRLCHNSGWVEAAEGFRQRAEHARADME